MNQTLKETKSKLRPSETVKGHDKEPEEDRAFYKQTHRGLTQISWEKSENQWRWGQEVQFIHYTYIYKRNMK